MQASDIPTRFVVPFANEAGPAYIRVVPVNSQVGVQGGAASLQDGFPPLTFLPVGGGGIPPFGSDMNGIINQMSAWARWVAAGGAPVGWDAAFSAAIDGYPFGAIVRSAVDPVISWMSTVDDNVTNPDTGGAGWVKREAVGGVLTGDLPNPDFADDPFLPGVPTAATPPVGTATARLATTAFVLPGTRVLAPTGYRMQADGFLEQWGVVSGINLPFSGATLAITWPIPFPTACYGVNVTVTGITPANGSSAPWMTGTGVNGTVLNWQDVDSALNGFFWRAWGK